ncbi:MAG TPA: DEAD/DEAH box helicase [Candidatus Fimivicinus intestinavium]|nr:DEAD/DEAH box helicase [Candidatus Fimivicinus intestinavium]
MENMFDRLAPYIQDYIYANNWSQLYPIQVAACRVIFDTDDHLLLSSGTASGKTEAAFLPVLTQLYHNPSQSVGVLYISPLKALINDQFKRLDDLLAESELPVCKWHGDASQAEKNRLLKRPQGILQITPESLESLLIRKRGACVKLFSDLRFVIIDEVHYFMRDVRGVQVLCLLERLERLVGVSPRRIGLSATLGDLSAAQGWLCSGTSRRCAAPVCQAEKQKIRLLVQRFQKADQTTPDGALDAGEAAHYDYLYRMTLDRKTILFTNSREETELVMANLRQLALKNKTPDVYRVHHGNISAVLREQAENEMKTAEEKLVTGATVTLELGIDIGSLDQVVQVGAPATVSSFAQRLGRCGRRGQVPQILFTFLDDVHTTAGDTLGPINWSFLRMLAIIELYTKQKWVEPLSPGRYPYAMLYHQTMSYLLSAGEASARELAASVLRLSCFRAIPQEDYRLLLQHLLAIGHLQRLEDGGLIIGRAGERVVNDYHFLAVFQVPEYYLVKDENRSIGTVDKIYPQGTRFALAGRTWETLEVNRQAKVLFVKLVPGVSTVDWDVDFQTDLHTVLVQKMRQILLCEEQYPYLSASCQERLEEIRYLARNSGILTNVITQLSENKFAIFPWVGTRELFTLHFLLLARGFRSKLLWRTCVYLEVTFSASEKDAKAQLENALRELAQWEGEMDLTTLPLPDKVQIEHKYNEFIPLELLRKEFLFDFLEPDGLREALSAACAFPGFSGDAHNEAE